jgi:hypothetical protein
MFATNLLRWEQSHAASNEALLERRTPASGTPCKCSSGVKGSGYRRFGGTAAKRRITGPRWITIQATPRHSPI